MPGRVLPHGGGPGSPGLPLVSWVPLGHRGRTVLAMAGSRSEVRVQRGPSRQNFPEGQGLPVPSVLLLESSLLSLSPLFLICTIL